jgi:hypothetical protein
MAQVPAQSFYNGPFAVYTSPTGMSDVNTGIPYLGGTLHEGDYCDLTADEAAQWNILYGSKLNAGRYRMVRVAPGSTYSSIKYGYPIGWGFPTSVGQVSIVGAGTVASGTAGTYTVTSSAAGGTAATATVTVSGGAITGAQLIYPGANMTSVPTWGLTEITGYVGGAGPLVAQMAYSSNVVGSFDTTGSSQISTVRGIALVPSITAAQITAGAWIVIQELGIAPVFVTTATATVPGSIAWSATAGAVTTAVIGTPLMLGVIGETLDTAAASTLVRVVLSLPTVQG